MATSQKIDNALLTSLLTNAHNSARLRAFHRLHEGDWEHCHQMLNALAVGTYVPPHRHTSEYQTEGFILLCGKMAVLVFDEAGNINQAESVMLQPSAGKFGINIKPHTWHTVIPIEDSVIFEVKGHPNGGYVHGENIEFAPWAPAEGTAAVSDYLQSLTTATKQLDITQ